MQAIRKLSIVGLIVGLSIGGLTARRINAQTQTDLAQTALAIVPQDAAFFATSINMRRGWEEFVQGNFVASLRRVAYVQALEQDLLRQWANPQGPVAQVKLTLENPNVRNIILLASDMVSQEFFVYGADDWCDMIEGLVEFQNEVLTVMQTNPEAMQEFFSELQREDVDRIRIPTTVLGFRLSDVANAQQQLDALEGILRLLGGQQEELKPFLDKLRRQDLADGQTLTFSLDTSLIPVEEVGEEERPVVEKLIELLEGRSLSISVGVKASLLLFAVGENADVLEEVGELEDALLDHESLDVLKESELTDLRAISFASERWRQSQWEANFSHYFRNLSLQFSVALNSSTEEIPDAEQWREDIKRDAEWIDEKIGELAPEFGDMLAWSRAIPGGSEGWVYDWSQTSTLENASPLEILNYSGERSLLLVGMKQPEIPELDEICSYILERVPEHARRFIAAAEEDEEDRELALKVFDRAWPMVEEVYGILIDKISPALEDNETLLSFAATWTTRNLGEALPDSAEPLPLPELAIACKLADRQLFIEGCREIYQVFDSAVELMRELNPDAIPADYVIPRPLEESIGEATSYSYAELTNGVDMDGFKPQLMVSDEVVIVGFSDRQVRDMLEAKALTTRPAWLTDDTPVAVVSYVDAAGLLAAMRPWIKYGLALSGTPLDQPLFPAEMPTPSGNDLLQIWDCFAAAGIAASTTSVDDEGPNVARWVWVGR